MALIQCSSCGAEFDDELGFCPDCGCQVLQEPPEQTELVELQDDDAGEPGVARGETQGEESKRKKVIVLACVAAAVVATIIMIVVCVSQRNTERRLAAYGDCLERATYKMLDGSADAEGAGNLIKQVWYDSIHEEFDLDTCKYTMENGKFYDDFNDALRALFRDSNFQTQISKLRNNQEEVNSLMKELRDPPEQYEEAYDQIKSYYDVYLEFTDMVIDPSGSLTSFSAAFNDADSRAIKAYRMMKLYLDD